MTLAIILNIRITIFIKQDNNEVGIASLYLSEKGTNSHSIKNNQSQITYSSII